MAIISFDKDAIIEYVPAYGGNRKSKDPCVVMLKFVPYARVQHYGKLITQRAAGKNEEEALEVAREVRRQQFCDNVEGVVNYFVGEREVKDAATFYDTADTELVIEIMRAMETAHKLSEGQRKN